MRAQSVRAIAPLLACSSLLGARVNLPGVHTNGDVDFAW
jgi:hypothetical protein